MQLSNHHRPRKIHSVSFNDSEISGLTMPAALLPPPKPPAQGWAKLSQHIRKNSAPPSQKESKEDISSADTTAVNTSLGSKVGHAIDIHSNLTMAKSLVPPMLVDALLQRYQDLSSQKKIHSPKITSNAVEEEKTEMCMPSPPLPSFYGRRTIEKVSPRKSAVLPPPPPRTTVPGEMVKKLATPRETIVGVSAMLSETNDYQRQRQSNQPWHRYESNMSPNAMKPSMDGLLNGVPPLPYDATKHSMGGILRSPQAGRQQSIGVILNVQPIPQGMESDEFSLPMKQPRGTTPLSPPGGMRQSMFGSMNRSRNRSRCSPRSPSQPTRQPMGASPSSQGMELDACPLPKKQSEVKTLSQVLNFSRSCRPCSPPQARSKSMDKFMNQWRSSPRSPRAVRQLMGEMVHQSKATPRSPLVLPQSNVSKHKNQSTRNTGRLLCDRNIRKLGSRVENLSYTDDSGNVGLYTGELNEHGQPHGKGRMKYDNGVFFEGVWKLGVQEGGLAQKERVMTGFSSWDGPKKKHAHGMIWVDHLGNAGRYSGKLDNGMPHGYGVMTYNNRLIVEGMWINGRLANDNYQGNSLSPSASPPGMIVGGPLDSRVH